jgi:hypothetical protein
MIVRYSWLWGKRKDPGEVVGSPGLLVSFSAIGTSASPRAPDSTSPCPSLGLQYS